MVELGLPDALRRLALPTEPGKEKNAVNAVRDFLVSQGISHSDQAEHLRQLTEDWFLTQQDPDPQLRQVIRKAITAAFPNADSSFSGSYHRAHRKLRDDHVLSFEEATALLSYAPVIRDLAATHRMSASAIARILTAHGFNREVSWRAVQAVLSAMKLKPELNLGNPQDPNSIEGVLASDLEQADQRFLDADIEAGAEMVGVAAKELGFAGDLRRLLLKLCRPDGNTFVPYLQILHFQCMVAAFYDHPMTMAYEFSPRGMNADFLGYTYQSVSDALNAFLNNMKAIERLDNAWARARDQERGRAHALVAILEGMDRITFASRLELATWIRQWLLRVIELSAPPENPVPTQASVQEIERILDHIASTPAGTGTRGVLEQRIVDALAATIHPEEAGWRSRGLGFPVNANNLSTRRLGDCDFQRPPTPNSPAELVAYEATAGELRRTYLMGHLQTLRRCARARLPELESIADPADWRLRVTFVAHSFDPELPTAGQLPTTDYSDLSIETEYITYGELINRADPAKLVEAFAAHVLAQLNEARTPRAVREAYLAMVELQ